MAKIPGIMSSKPRATGARGVRTPKTASVNSGAAMNLTPKSGRIMPTQGMLQGSDGLKTGGMPGKKKPAKKGKK